MPKYIDKSALLTEIENLLDKSNYYDDYNCAFRDGNNASLYALKGYINTLEGKEINNVWHNAKRTIPENGIEQIICIKEDGLAVSTVGKIVNGTIKWAYLNDLLDISSFSGEVKDLEKEIIRVSKNEYFDFTDWKSIARHFFEFGLKAQKG